MSKQSISSRLDELESETENDTDGVTVAYSTPGTDELTDGDGNRVDPDDVDGQLIVINRSLVMPREQAERENREILEPAENAAEDAVKVPIGL